MNFLDKRILPCLEQFKQPSASDAFSFFSLILGGGGGGYKVICSYSESFVIKIKLAESILIE